MQTMDDLALLREYAANHSETAFAELVSRRLDFVYSAALRQTANPNLAEDITQAVFVILAQKAGKIPDKTVLAGWLFKTTRFAALAQIRAEAKRSLRKAAIEKELQMQCDAQSVPEELWNQMSPLLDEALATLGEKDRQAVLLRFLENKSLAEVGGVLGAGEDTARKRVARALEKLRKFFVRRGVGSTTGLIAGAISTHSVHAAPVGLAKTISSVAIVKGTTASTSTLTIIKGALKIMAWSKAKIAIVAGAAVLLAAGTTTAIIRHQRAQSTQPAPIAFTPADFPKTSWHFAGYADPESAFESVFWAMNQGDVKSYLASLAPDGGLFRETQGIGEKQIAEMNKQVVDGIIGYKIIDKKSVSDDEVIITFQPETSAGQKSVHSGRMVIRLIGNEWKVSG